MAGLFSWLGKRVRLTDGAFWGAFFGGTSYSGRTVTLDGAMKLSAWWACVRLISETLGTLPLAVYERTNGESRPRPDHPLHRIIHLSPNADQTPVEFWEGQVAPICIVGNSYAEKVFLNDRLVALQPIAFDECRVTRQENGGLLYTFLENGAKRSLPESRVFHIRGFGTGGDMGLSPIAYARNTLGGAADTEEAAARMFGTGMRASGFMTSPQVLTADQRRQAREKIIKPLEGPEAEGAIGLLEGGWKWQPSNITPKDAEMILSRRFNVEDICRWMGVPPILVGHAGEGQTMWGSGVEQIMLGWLVLGLRAYIRRIEAAINKRLVLPAEQGRIYAEYNIDGLIRADSAGRAELMGALAQNGLRTRNELRRLDNFPPVPGADQLTVQSNLVPLDELGNVSANVARAYLSFLEPRGRHSDPDPSADPGVNPQERNR